MHAGAARALNARPHCPHFDISHILSFKVIKASLYSHLILLHTYFKQLAFHNAIYPLLHFFSRFKQNILPTIFQRFLKNLQSTRTQIHISHIYYHV